MKIPLRECLFLATVFLCSCGKPEVSEKSSKITGKSNFKPTLIATDSDLAERLANRHGLPMEEQIKLLQETAKATLQSLVEAKTAEERLALVIDPESAIPSLSGNEWKETYSKIDYAKALLPAALVEDDVKRGIHYLLLPASAIPARLSPNKTQFNLLSPALSTKITELITTSQTKKRIYPLIFKTVDNKTKIDWNTLQETISNKYLNFLSSPEIGKKAQLRVNLQRSAFSAKEGYKAIFIDGFSEDSIVEGIRMLYPEESTFAQEISKKLNYSKVPFITAFCELSWDIPAEKNHDHLQLAITKLICWELPGIGAEERDYLNIAVENCYSD